MARTVEVEGKYSDAVINICLDTIGKGKQALVFCNTRRGAESQAERIAQKVQTQSAELLNVAERGLKTLPSPTKQCKRLALCLKKGIAFHHAGLHAKQRELIETKFREGVIKIICSTPTLCLSGETRIWHGSTETSVSQLFPSQTIYALSKNSLQRMKPRAVETIQNQDSLIQITSAAGYNIKVTPHHKMLVKREGKRMLLKAAELQKQDKVATVGRLPLERCVSPKISDFVLDNVLGATDRRFDEELAYFIGVMLGDGYSGAETRDCLVSYKGSPGVVGIDDEIFRSVKSVCKHLLLSTRASKTYHGTPQLILGKHKWFREFLVRCGVEVRERKHISYKLMNLPLEQTAALLRGLFDTAGCAEKRSISFSNISERMVQQMQRLLLRFGIVSRIRRRKKGTMKIYEREYSTKTAFELQILHKRSILDFYRHINFGIGRKKDALLSLVSKIASNLHYVSCHNCSYKIYRDLFTGRSSQHKVWGRTKKEVILALGEKGELSSRQLASLIGKEPRKGELRLNQHYELIKKRKKGSRSKSEWFWQLNGIGAWIYKNILEKNLSLETFFSRRECPLCQTELDWIIKKGWRNEDFEGDIYWDMIRGIKRVSPEPIVYDVVLPKKPTHDHLFVAEGFIVHNSMGLDLPAFRVIIRDLKRFSGSRGMIDIPVLEYHQQAGRAGRPGMEEFGEAIILAETKDQKEARAEQYVRGEPEEILSKLAVEPVLRTYVLSLIASDFVATYDGLYEFFGKTFYAKQYGDMRKLHAILDAMVAKLEEWEFLKVAGSEGHGGFVVANEVLDGKLEATLLGRRVAELYLDPYTAHFLITCLQRATQKGMHDFAILHMLSSCLELRPLLRPRMRELDELLERTNPFLSELLAPEPVQYSEEYEEFLKTLKTAIFFQDWISEVQEDVLLEKLGIAPGEVRSKLERADWLMYATEELARILNYQMFRSPLAKMRMRLKHGAKEELLPLLRLRGIGRVRARKLFNARIKSLEDVKKADLSTLAALVGKAPALSIKKQVGQDLREEKVQVKTGKRKGQKSVKDYTIEE